jgi:hypothetical protein
MELGSLAALQELVSVPALVESGAGSNSSRKYDTAKQQLIVQVTEERQ